MKGHIRKRTTKSGNTWQIAIELGMDENGNRKRMYKSTNGTKKEAEKIMIKLISELEEGTLVQESSMTVATYLRNWLKTYVEINLSPTSIDGYRDNIEKYIIPHIGNIPLQKLSPLHLQDMYLKLSENGKINRKGGLAPRSIRYIHMNLSKALREAVKMQIIKRNVATMVTIPKVKTYRAAVYNEQEIISLLNIAKGTDMEVPITLAATLGLRRGEILGLKWSDINFHECRLIINNNLVSTSEGAVLKTPKTESSHRTIEISDSIVTMLKKHLIWQKENKIKLGRDYCDNSLVCCYPDGNLINPKVFSKKFTRFLERNNLKNIRFHDLRHSNATLMLEYGIPAKVASERLGHSSISVTLDIYSHVTSKMQKDVADKIESGILNKVLTCAN